MAETAVGSRASWSPRCSLVPLANPATVAPPSGTSVVTAAGVYAVAMSALRLRFATRPGIPRLG